MALAKKVPEGQQYAKVLEFFTQEDIQNNLTFLMLVDTLLNRSIVGETNDKSEEYIQIIDPMDENNILYYTNDKFMEVIESDGLNGFIY